MSQQLNHFFHRGRPVQDPTYFFGRQQELQEARTLLFHHQSVSLVGPRRIGKTSFLHQLAQQNTPPQSQFIYLDCSPCKGLSAAEFYAFLLHELAYSLPENILSNQQHQLETITFWDLRQIIQAITQQNMHLIIMLDEFEALASNTNLNQQTFSELRSLTDQDGITFITASLAPLLSLTYSDSSVLSSPFFNIFASIQLGMLTPGQAKTLLTTLASRGQIPFEPDLIVFLLDLAGPHPLYLQIAGYYAFQQLAASDRPDDNTREKVTHSFVRGVADHWLYSWQALSPQNQKLLACLAFATQVEDGSLQDLINACVVQSAGLGGPLIPLSTLFQRFVNRQPVAGLLQIPPLTLEPTKRLSLRQGTPIALTPTEFELLAYLLQNAGQVVSYQQLYSTIWPDDAVQEPDLERLKTVIKTVRRALQEDKDCLQNVARVGYQFVSKS